MTPEIICKIEIADTGELILCLEGTGNAGYQYVYREAKGVYWDNDKKGFKSTDPKNWSYSQWYRHIVDVVNSGLGVELKMGQNIEWVKVPEQDKNEIVSASQ